MSLVNVDTWRADLARALQVKVVPNDSNDVYAKGGGWIPKRFDWLVTLIEGAVWYGTARFDMELVLIDAVWNNPDRLTALDALGRIGGFMSQHAFLQDLNREIASARWKTTPWGADTR